MGLGDDGLAAGGLQNDETPRLFANLWRGSLLQLECAAVVNGMMRFIRSTAAHGFGAASQPSGSKLPRHHSNQDQSSRAFTDLGDNRKLRKLRFTLLRWFTRLGPRAMATPIANTSITTRWAIREVSGV